MQKTYYWLNSIDLEPGSVVNPGNWARIVGITPNHQWALLEEVYERIRKAQFGNLPSRKKGIFVFNQDNIARQFRDTQRVTDLMYEVEIIDDSEALKLVTLDMQLVRPYIENSILSTAELEKQAVTYWKSSGEDVTKQFPEVLSESPIRIVRKLD